MTNFRTHYDNLNVTQNAQSGVIKAAYKALCQSYHPDKCIGGDEQANRIMKFINKAYTVLSDPIKRAEHDRWIAKHENIFSSSKIIDTTIIQTSNKHDNVNHSDQLTYHNDTFHTENTSRFNLSPAQVKNEHHLWVA